MLALLRPKSRQFAQEMRTVPHRIQFDKVTHGVCSELSTENVDKATGVEKRLHHDDNPMSARKNRKKNPRVTLRDCGVLGRR
ncbi:hypothetical protein FZC23_08075 [Vibrio cholerae]|nr:hypothetical protein F0Q05_07225 [Vibrio cholerae]KAA1219536.1 hypothetical protein F0P99_08390 [Vibrio cholerae]TYW53642.1 hypothetical protein FY559_13830 [Vibrio cholerae]TYZ02243.1 hypothetical protein FZC23_08075 [Vibrio cholerae]TYZ11131.1 hypothetical protein FZC24_12655 [Vibrio cholerae]